MLWNLTNAISYSDLKLVQMFQTWWKSVGGTKVAAHGSGSDSGGAPAASHGKVHGNGRSSARARGKHGKHSSPLSSLPSTTKLETTHT